MKKVIYTFGLFLAIGLTSCSGSIEDAAAGLEELSEDLKAEPTVVGDWKLSAFDMGMEIPAEQAEMFAAIEKEMIDNSTMTFSDDGTYTQKDKMQGQATTKTGTYSVKDGKLTTTTEEGIASTLNIASLTDTELEVSFEDNGTTMSMTYTRK